MKKTVLFIALAFGLTSSFAQDLTSKKGEPILPEGNDWAISMDADPIFSYLGGMFHKSDNSTTITTTTPSGSTATTTSPSSIPGVGFLNGNQTIIGKKFIDEHSAYRVLVRIGFTSQATKAMVGDGSVTAPIVYPAAPGMVEDKMSNKNTNIGIGVGKEWRRGKTRLQGFYGADVMIWIASMSTKYSYGNALSNNSSTPHLNGVVSDTSGGSFANTTNFGSNITHDDYGNPARVTSWKSGMTFGIGVRGFIGAEYFIMPKISLGAEYGWGIGFQSSGKGTKAVEALNAGTNTVGTETTKTSGSSKFGLDTDINQNTIFGFLGSNTGTASLRVTFHF